MALVFQDVLDTVRTSGERELQDQAGTLDAHLHARSTMVLFALLGHQQLLSQTQAFDSRVVLDCLTDSDEQEVTAFLKLFEDGDLRVALYGANTLWEAFRANIARMELSGWPEIHDPRSKKEDPERKKALVETVLGSSDGKALPDSARATVDAIRRLSDYVSRAPARFKHRAAKTNLQLQDYLDIEFRRILQSHKEEDARLTAVLSDLCALRKKDGSPEHGRSVHYAVIREKSEQMNLSQSERDTLISAVDFAYNTVMSHSVGAPQFRLTTRRRRAFRTIARKSQGFAALVPRETFKGIENCSWDSLYRFAREWQDHNFHSRLRRAAGASFLVSVLEDRSAWAMLAPLSATALRLAQTFILGEIFVAAGELTSEKFEEALPEDFKDTMIERLNGRLGLEELVQRPAEKLASSKHRKRIRRALDSVRLRTGPEKSL